MKKLFYFLSVISIAFASCEKEVNLDVPQLPSRLAVTASWNQNDPSMVHVAQTRNVTDRSRSNAVANAQVQVFRDNVLYDQLVYDATLERYKSATGKLATPGGVYQVKVTASGFTEVKSPQVGYPAPISIKSFEHKKEVAGEDFLKEDELVLTWEDNGATEDYYRVKIMKLAFGKYPVGFSVYPLDNDVEESVDGLDMLDETRTYAWNDRIILSDKNFNGQTKRLRIRVDSHMLTNQGGGDYMHYILLERITADEFNYVKVRILDSEDPFSTPVQAFTNITNGYGIFSLYSNDKRDIK